MKELQSKTQDRSTHKKYCRFCLLPLAIVFLVTFSFFPIEAATISQITTDLSHSQFQTPSLKHIKQRGTLLIAMYYKDVKPFYFTNKIGEFTGIDVELIRGFARLLGVKAEFNRSARTFNGVINKVFIHEADVAISKLGMTFSRAMRVRYTNPYIMLHQGLLINRLELARQAKGRHQIEVIKTLRGRVGVIAKSSYVENAKERFKLLTAVGYPSWDDVIKAAVVGEVVAAYRDEVEVKKIIRDQPDTAIKFISVVMSDAKDPKAMVVAWDNSYLQYLLNLYIQYLDLNLTANKVLDQYDEMILKIKTKTTVK